MKHETEVLAKVAARIAARRSLAKAGKIHTTGPASQKGLVNRAMAIAFDEALAILDETAGIKVSINE